jgi:hypothetical protein
MEYPHTEGGRNCIQTCQDAAKVVNKKSWTDGQNWSLTQEVGGGADISYQENTSVLRILRSALTLNRFFGNDLNNGWRKDWIRNFNLPSSPQIRVIKNGYSRTTPKTKTVSMKIKLN